MYGLIVVKSEYYFCRGNNELTNSIFFLHPPELPLHHETLSRGWDTVHTIAFFHAQGDRARDKVTYLALHFLPPMYPIPEGLFRPPSQRRPASIDLVHLHSTHAVSP